MFNLSSLILFGFWVAMLEASIGSAMNIVRLECLIVVVKELAVEKLVG